MYALIPNFSKISMQCKLGYCFTISSGVYCGSQLVQNIWWRGVPVLVTRPLRTCADQGLHKEQLLFGAGVKRSGKTSPENYWIIRPEAEDTSWIYK